MKHLLAKTMLAVGAVVLVVVSVTQARADCFPGPAKVITGSSSVITTSMTFVDIPKAAVEFISGGNRCVLAHFSAETIAPGNEAILVQMVLDGVTIFKPGPVTWVATDGSAIHSVLSFEFFVGAIAPGVHTAKVQWRSQNGNAIQLTNRTLIVVR
jgi:hypothetical protein